MIVPSFALFSRFPKCIWQQAVVLKKVCGAKRTRSEKLPSRKAGCGYNCDWPVLFLHDESADDEYGGGDVYAIDISWIEEVYRLMGVGSRHSGEIKEDEALCVLGRNRRYFGLSRVMFRVLKNVLTESIE